MELSQTSIKPVEGFPFTAKLVSPATSSGLNPGNGTVLRKNQSEGVAMSHRMLRHMSHEKESRATGPVKKFGPFVRSGKH